MNCPNCRTTDTRVTCVRRTAEETKRYCRCLTCQHRYITLESYAVPPKVVKVHPRQIKRGEENNLAVLTERNVLDIRDLAKTTTYAVIAKRYGIHKDTVYRIVTFKRWSHLKPDCSST